MFLARVRALSVNVLVLGAMLGCAVSSCTDSSGTPRSVLFHTAFSDSTELIVYVDSIQGKYLQNIKVLDQQGAIIEEVLPTRLFESESASVHIPSGTYNLSVQDYVGYTYSFDLIKIVNDTTFWSFECSDFSPPFHLHAGSGTESVALVNEIEYMGSSRYGINCILFSPVESISWESAFLPNFPLQYGDTLSLHLDTGEYDFLIRDTDFDWYHFTIFAKGSQYTRAVSIDDIIDYSIADRNVNYENCLQEAIVYLSFLTAASGENYISGNSLESGDSTYINSSYGVFTPIIRTETGSEYTIPLIKVSDSRGDINISVMENYNVLNPRRLQTHILGEGTHEFDIVNETNHIVESLIITKIDSNTGSSWQLPWYSLSEAMCCNDTLPVLLQEGEYMLYALLENSSGSIVDTFQIDSDSYAPQLELKPYMMLNMPARYTVGAGECRIDIINSLIASDFSKIFMSPSDSVLWGTPVSGALKLCPGDTMSIMCQQGTYDLYILDSDLDGYTARRLNIGADSVYIWSVAYSDADRYMLENPQENSINIINKLQYDISYLYIREHGTFDWGEDNLLGDDILYRGQMFKCHSHVECFDLYAICTDWYNYYYEYRIDSICTLVDNQINVEFTPASAFAIDPTEIEHGLYRVGDGSSEVTVVNHSGETINYLYLSPSEASGWGDDLLGATLTLNAGASIIISCDPGMYDLKCELANYEYCVFWNLNANGCIEVPLDCNVGVVRSGFGEETAHSIVYMGEQPVLRIVNGMPVVLWELYIREAGTEHWGKDLLLNEFLASGGETILTVDPGSYDVKAIIRSEETREVTQEFCVNSIVVSDSLDQVWYITGRDLIEFP